MNHNINYGIIRQSIFEHILHNILKYKNNWIQQSERIGRERSRKLQNHMEQGMNFMTNKDKMGQEVK
jgi:hypothetical protein